MRKKRLSWGQTPFHRMTKKQLLVHAMRMYSALESTRSALAISKHNESSHPYWINGTGGRALEKAEQALQHVNKGFDMENVYRSFFRYGIDLLFDDTDKIGIKTKWGVCDKCDCMYGGNNAGIEIGEPLKDTVGQPCITPNCDGVLRALTWGDLKIKTKE